MKRFIVLLFMLICLQAEAQRVYLWPEGKMPDQQPHQYAAMTDVSKAEGFKAEDHPTPYIDWLPAPEKPCGACMILISGGSYKNTCDVSLVKMWGEEFTKLGFQCVNLVYRTPRPKGLPIYQSAWEDGQRAVRMVRKEAMKRGFDPEKIGVIAMSAGGHLGLLLGSSSQTAAYKRIDAVDDIPCHINWAILNAPAYVTSDGENGTRATYQGYGTDVQLSQVFKFDEKTCPMSLHHGNIDPYSPNGSTLVYRRLRRMGVPAELHLYPGKKHGAYGFERAVEFMTQMGYLGPVATEEKLLDRVASDADRAEVIREDIWPEGKTPDFRENQCKPYIEWHIPKELKTSAIQIIYSGGGYDKNNPDGFEVAPPRRYLNAKGMTVVTLKYRTPRPEGLSKHTTAWQDLQRTIRLVRSEAAARGLDPDRIGIMGSSAGGHLTLMGTTSSLHQSYLPIDDVDKLSCKVQWGIGIYPAYVLSDGLDWHNTSGGNDDGLFIAPEFSFDKDTAPLLLIHGDADPWASMNSVAVWEKMRAMGIDCELHTLATRKHCFQRSASPGTGSYTWMDRIGEFLQGRAFETVTLSDQAVVSIVPNSTMGTIKPMNAGNNGPTDRTMETYKALRVPYARTHDTPLGTEYGGHCIDIDQVFPDFNANVNSPKSYDFEMTDSVLCDIIRSGAKPFYRLGQSIEHQYKKYGIYPPANYKKWAKVCEHIIRHYNEGWAGGFHMGIEYWEIWNEPDLDQPDERWKTDPRTWGGTMEQFDELYVVTAKHLKKCFPDLKIGGPAFANPRKYGPGFLDYVRDKGAPLDFFSHHMYHRKPARIVEDVRIIREMLDAKGFAETESILNEWNYNRGWDDESDFYGRRMRPTIKGAAFVAATMCACQAEPLDMLMYYDLRPNTIWCGPWSPFVYEIRPTYWSLYYWAELADYGTAVESACDTGNIYTCAAKSADGRNVRLLIVRYHEDDSHNTPREITLNLPAGWQVAGIRITDSKGQDQSLAPAGSVLLESNSIALIDIQNINN